MSADPILSPTALDRPRRLARSAAAAACAALGASLLAGCSGGSSGEAPPAPPPGATDEAYSIGGTVSGLTASSVRTSLDYRVDGEFQRQDLTIAANGSFTFPSPIPDGTRYEIVVSQTSDYEQDCRAEHDIGVVSGADVTDVEIVCHDAYAVGGQVNGLRNPGLVLLVVQTMPDEAPQNFRIEIDGDGPFSTIGNGFIAGDGYEVTIERQPTGQICVVDGGVGVIEDRDVTDILVTCGDATLSYTVEGLLGTGLIVSLKREVEVNGAVQMLVVEKDKRAEDGVYTFETPLDLGESYEVGIWQQPADPDQECWVDNDRGIVEGDITDVVVHCPKPYRYYRYDDSYTMLRAVPSHLVDPADPDPPVTPLEDAELFGGGLLHDDHWFDTGQGVPLGSASGLASEELFEKYLDARTPAGLGDAVGVVHSSLTGETYWLAVESPPGVPLLHPTGTVFLTSHYASLDTAWAFRKVGQATFRLELTHADLLGFDNIDHWWNPQQGHLRAGVELRVRAFRAGAGTALDDDGLDGDGLDGDGPSAETFFDIHGKMDLVGMGVEEDQVVAWELEPEVRGDALDSLWATDDAGEVLVGDFTLDTAAGSDRFENQVARARLVKPIVVEIDLSGVPVGEDIVVLSEARVEARNSYSPEGGTAAYLRDPASTESEAGEGGEPPAGLGGINIQTTGLLMLAIEDATPIDTLRDAEPPPPTCDTPGGETSTLEIEAASYTTSESRDNRTPVRIIRTGSLVGAIAARVRLTGGSAAPVDDFDDAELIVRFGDGSAAPRTLDLPIADDGEVEPDETLTLALVDAEGCAEIGAQATAEVTIVDDDAEQGPGSIAFGSASFGVDEGTGVATLSVVRTGGTDGAVVVTIQSADGSATGGASGGDYVPILSSVTFGDGDAGPHEVAVSIVDDAIAEADETATFTLSGPLGSIGGPATAVLTIRDDDQAQADTVQFSAAEFAALEADGVASVTITRHGDVAGEASVTLATRDGTALAGEDYESVDTVVTFSAGESARDVEIVLVASADAEADETVILELAAPAGAALGAPATAALVIADGGAAPRQWLPDIELDDAAGAANDAQIAFDGNGNALALWVQEAGSRTDIWSNYYQAGVGWGTAVLVEENDADPYAGSPRVAFDAEGRAHTVWTQTDAATGNASAWANRFVPGGGWGVPELLESEPGEVSGNVELAVHEGGDAIAVWTQFDGTAMAVYASRHEPAGGWGTAEVIDNGSFVASPNVAVGAAGEFLALWQQSGTGVLWDVWASRLTGETWEPPVHVSTTNTGTATSPKAAYDGAGNAFAVWLQNPGFDRAVYAARLPSGGNWETPRMIGPGDGAEQHQVAADTDGNVVAIWRRPETVNGVVVLTAFANRYTPGGDWAAPEPVSALDVFYPKAAPTSGGNALAVWAELDLRQPLASAYSVWANGYS
ncbi:MAG: hypothetical protein JXB36_19035, partial [Gammaproteobacteria bacterium]|nr:hypothetical protein [Gammaproteobacteria bacterium]